jgi:WD40 repeat protein/tRNA A-37 threonylcarbamoyl transferase component Bud32
MNPPVSRATEVLDRFESAWNSDAPPGIDAFWAAVRADLADAERPAVLADLVKLDLGCRWRLASAPTGSSDLSPVPGNLPLSPRLENYAARLPDLGPPETWAPALIAEEYHVRHRWGDRPGHGEFLRRFPTIAGLPDALRRCDTELEKDPAPFQMETVASGTQPVPAPLPPPVVLRTFGDYDLLQELGHGGMGVVYKARQRRLDRLVALKIIRPERISEKAILQRFEREIRAAARLAHPNIVTIHDASEVDGVPFLAMEYLEGLNFVRMIRQHGVLVVRDACECARQTAVGLQHIFERGLIHRDIKPSNLILSNHGLVKILDLGLARCFTANNDDTLTRTDAMLGTPDYVAPEQAEDARNADIRSDLYGLGCTLYFLLAGEVPYPGGTALQKLDRHRFGTPRPVQECRPEVPPNIAAVVARLMAKRPADRYQTPAEVVAALEECLRAAERRVAGDSSPRQPRPPVKEASPAEPDGRTDRLGRPSGKSPAPTAPEPEAAPKGPQKSSEPLRRFAGHAKSIEAVAFSPDGRRLVTASMDQFARVWDRETGLEVRRVEAHLKGVLCVAFTPIGRRLVTGGRDRCLRLWDIDTGQRLMRFDGHADDVNSLALTPDGKFLFSASSDHTLRLWELLTGKEIRRIGSPPKGSATKERAGDALLYVAVTPDGKRAITGGRDRTLRMWDIGTGREEHRFPDHSVAVYCVAVSPDGRHLLSAGGNSVRLFDIQSGTLIQRFKGHDKAVLSIGFGAGGQRVVSGSKDGTVRVWDAASGEELECFTGHKGWVMGVAYDPEGRFVLSGGADKTACLWRLT